MLDKKHALPLVAGQLLPALTKERAHLDEVDNWYRWKHDNPHKPRQATQEYQQLVNRAQTPWLNLVVTNVAQALYVEGYRASGASENAPGWRGWQANGMDGRQIAIHRAGLAYGHAYATCTPGQHPFTGEPLPVMRGHSPRRLVAFYADPAHDEWPTFALRRETAKIQGGSGAVLHLYDDEVIHRIEVNESGRFTYIEHRPHGAPVCPVVRYANQLDLEGRTPGEVEPFIPLAGRIDQTVFDRLVVQRFASWVVRTIAGMDLSASAEASNTSTEKKRMELRVEDLLVAKDSDTKFGSLPASPLDGFIHAKDADIRDLAAVSQTPPHHLLGQMANLSAEALAAAEAATNRKVEERKHAFGESHEQLLRLWSWMAGDQAAAMDTAAQVRWRDMESRSLAQVADALGKLAQMLGVPVEMLWERIPGWTETDVERARDLVKQNGGMDALVSKLMGAADPTA